MTSLVNILQMTGGKRFRTLWADSTLLVVVLSRYMLQQRFLPLELTLTMRTRKRFGFIVSFYMCRKVVSSGEGLFTLITAE